MFGNDFFPTPEPVINQMLAGVDVVNKVVLEPSAGKGNIVSRLLEEGAKEVLAIEKDPDLRRIVENKCKVIGNDFLQIQSDQISHINLIVMNPPFSADEKHINHAYDIAPAGCHIVALCNLSTVKNPYSEQRKRLVSVIENYGTWSDLGECFSAAERTTRTTVALVHIQKPANDYKAEFDGFFLEDDPVEEQANSIISYNAVRDLVNRYVAAIKLYDEQLKIGVQMDSVLNGVYGEKLTFTCTENGAPKLRNDFKKDLQKAGWKYIFQKMNLERIATRGLKEDINRFVEQQQEIPFTMRNIYRMLDIVIGTRSQQMDKAILEVFNRLTEHHHDNRYNVPGWKTNSHFLVNRKFILPGMCAIDKWHTGNKIQTNYGSYFYLIEDAVKALCYLTGDNFEKFGRLEDHIRYSYKLKYQNKIEYFHDYDRMMQEKVRLQNEGIQSEVDHSEPFYGELFDWSFFQIRAYKKGTMHFEFKDADLWAKFNQRVAKLKGYPLFEPKQQTAYQNRQTGRSGSSVKTETVKPTVLFKFKVQHDECV